MPRAELEAKLQTLGYQAWDQEISWPAIEAWAKNFTGRTLKKDDEQLHCLFALTRFMYFGKRMMREMLKALYRDHFEAPLIQRIRRNLGGTRDEALLRNQFEIEAKSSRFLGMGNPAESGAHLLYYFRQVNYLAKDQFVDISAAFTPKIKRSRATETVVLEPRESGVSRYVFFDDLVGSGTQATDYLSQSLAAIRRGGWKIDLKFMCLFATSTGLQKMNEPSMFDGNAISLFELDDTYRAFSDSSRYFLSAPDWFVPANFRAIALKYGAILQPARPLGYKDGQLMLGFSHNTPDNTLPIFWDEGTLVPWSPTFFRFDKNYN